MLSDIDKVETENSEMVVDDKYVADLWVMIMTAQWTTANISCPLQTVTLMTNGYSDTKESTGRVEWNG